MRQWKVGLAAAAIAGLVALGATSGQAALKVGTKAPDFRTVGAVGGKPFNLHLAKELRKGPVVIYFFPKAFTQGCTLEAHAFSDATADFRKAGAEVIGLSTDNLATLKKFSIEECRNAFPVATATPAIVKAYDVAFLKMPGLTNRTSYVINRDGRVVMVHSDLDWSEHVTKTLAAVKALHRSH